MKVPIRKNEVITPAPPRVIASDRSVTSEGHGSPRAARSNQSYNSGISEKRIDNRYVTTESGVEANLKKLKSENASERGEALNQLAKAYENADSETREAIIKGGMAILSDADPENARSALDLIQRLSNSPIDSAGFQAVVDGFASYFSDSNPLKMSGEKRAILYESIEVLKIFMEKKQQYIPEGKMEVLEEKVKKFASSYRFEANSRNTLAEIAKLISEAGRISKLASKISVAVNLMNLKSENASERGEALDQLAKAYRNADSETREDIIKGGMTMLNDADPKNAKSALDLIKRLSDSPIDTAGFQAVVDGFANYFSESNPLKMSGEKRAILYESIEVLKIFMEKKQQYIPEGKMEVLEEKVKKFASSYRFEANSRNTLTEIARIIKEAS